MADRTVTDVAGRTWTCVPEAATAAPGRDVVLTCQTPSVAAPVSVSVGWQWESISENGLARLIAKASPVPRR
jgi:hypothetical protein